MLKSKNKNRKNGFTLTELLVVIAILTMFTIISIPSYGVYNKTLAVKGSARDIRSLLWEAQALSLGPKTEDAKTYFIDIDKAKSEFFLQQDPENTTLKSKSTLYKFSTIESINADTISGNIDAVKVSFDTGLVSGKSQNAGLITFLKTDGTAFSSPPNKVTINLKSSVSSNPTKYKVVIDKNLGAIIVSPN